ncbi:MAG: clostripain-related cysteine peptidase [bacterium]|nr:clostripain-related cysteine peptidase [bacterium]
MRKTFWIILFILSCFSAETVVTAPSRLPAGRQTRKLLSNGYSYNINRIKLSVGKGTKGPIDTLIPDLAPPFYCWDGDYKSYRVEYEATQFIPEMPCSVMAIIHGVISDTTASKQCSLFVWSDSSGKPGTRLFSIDTLMTADSAGVFFNIYPLSSPVYVTGPFWVGDYEGDTLMPATVFDSTRSLLAMFNIDSSGWTEDNVDYCHGAIVKYDTSSIPIHKKWTIIVFINGDNELEPYAIEDINKLEAGIDTSRYTVVVELDRIPGYDSSNGDWTTARRYLITPDNIPDNIIRSDFEADLGEVNMGDQASIADFVRWGVANYPADNYVLIIWGHGNGWYKGAKPSLLKGISEDVTNNDYIGVANGEYALVMDSVKNILEKRLDILVNDACYMGMQEVAYEIQNCADYIVFSEYTIPSEGYPYDSILTWLNANYSATPEELANITVDKYIASYGGGDQVTLSSVVLGEKFSHLSECINVFAKALIFAGGRSNVGIDSARFNTEEYFGYPNSHIDIYDFASRIKGIPGLFAEAKDWADSVMNAVDSVVTRKGQINCNGSHGIAIYYPYDINAIDTTYTQLAFAKDLPKWWDFINGDTIGITENTQLPVSLALCAPMPNPAFAFATIKYSLPNKANISLRLFDLTGRLVKTLYSGEQVAGTHNVSLKSSELSKGIYFVTLQTGTVTKTQKLTILR